jgi:hypothetical protein
MRRTVIAGLLLAGSATTTLAADPAAGQKIPVRHLPPRGGR